MFENDEMYDIPNDMLCEYQEVASEGKYRLLEMDDKYVHPDGVSYELIERYFPNYQIQVGKDYLIADDNKIYNEDIEL